MPQIHTCSCTDILEKLATIISGMPIIEFLPILLLISCLIWHVVINNLTNLFHIKLQYSLFLNGITWASIFPLHKRDPYSRQGRIRKNKLNRGIPVVDLPLFQVVHCKQKHILSCLIISSHLPQNELCLKSCKCFLWTKPKIMYFNNQIF